MKMRKLLLLCVVAMFTMLSVISVNMATAKTAENAASVGVYAANRDDSELLSKYLAEPIEASDYYIDANQEIEVIIELSGIPGVLSALADMPYAMTVAEFAQTSDYASLINEIKKSQDKLIAALGSIFSHKESFDIVNNAVTGIMKYSDYAALPSNSAVNKMISGLAVSREYTVPETANSAVHMQVDLVRQDVELGYRGEGMLVGVLDTGLFVGHEAFQVMPPAGTLKYSSSSYVDGIASLLAAKVGGNVLTSASGARCPWQNTKVVYTFDYTGNVVNVSPTATTANNLTHGTHVAGIAAGNNGKGFEGVAPDAQLAIFKVFNSSGGGATTPVIMRAVQDAAIVGCDVLNMSLGYPSGFVVPDVSEVDIYAAARKAGLVITNSAGNAYTAAMSGNLGSLPSWANPDYGVVGADSTYPTLLSIASNNPYYSFLATVAEGTDNEFAMTYNEIPDRVMGTEILGTKDSVSYEFVIIPNFGRPADFEGIDCNGKIALISRGDGVSFEDKIKNAGAAGAVGAIIYDNAHGALINMQIDSATIPGCFISLANGEKLLSLPAGERTISFAKDKKVLTMSDFSCWGIPSVATMVLKPEITAPGGNVYSSIPAASGSTVVSRYEWMGGTSMAAPNAAGSTAIVKQYLKEFMPDENEVGISPAEKTKRINDKYLVTIRLMMSTATQNSSPNNVEYSPRKQGAGMIQLYNAIKTTAYISVDGQEMTKLELGDDKQKTGVYEMSFNVVNFGATDLTYIVKPIALTDELGAVINGVQTVSLMAYRLNPTYSVLGGSTVTVPAGQTVQVNLTLTLSPEDRAYLDKFPNGEFVDGFIKLYQQDVENPIDLVVPFLSFYGDWELVPFMDAYEISGVAFQEMPTRMRGRGFTSSTLYVMGDYTLILESGVAKPVGNIERAALSPLNTKSIFYTLHGLTFGLLRNVWEFRVSIVDRVTGQIYYSYIEDGMFKTFMNQQTAIIASPGATFNGGNATYGYRFSGQNVKEGYANLPNNTKLELRVESLMQGQDTFVNSIAYPFTIDNTAPVIAGEAAVTYEKDGRTYIEVDVWDNHYLMAYDAWFTSWNGDVLRQGSRILTNVRPIPVYGQEIAGETHTLTFDITNKGNLLSATNYIQMSVIDYAYNEIIWNVPVVAGNPSVKANAGEYSLEKIPSTAPASDFVVNSHNELIKYTGSASYLVIPDYITRIGANAFADFMPATIVINENVKAIAENAFIQATGFSTTLTFTGEYAPILEGGYVNNATNGYNAEYANFGEVYIMIPVGGIGYGYNWTGLQLNEVKIVESSGNPEIDIYLARIRELEAQIIALKAQIDDMGDISKAELEILTAQLAEAVADYATLLAEYNELASQFSGNYKELLEEIEALKAQLKSQEELQELRDQIAADRKVVTACSSVNAGSTGGWTGAILVALALCGMVLISRKKKITA